MKTVDRKDLEALVAEQREKREPSAQVVRVDETHLQINGHDYEIVADVRQGFNLEEFAQRYSTILSKYDYLVGDWGFEQLRLKGFYAEDRAGAKQNQIDAVQDYLYESCNFGCAYFILHNLDAKPVQKPRRNRSRRRNGSHHGNHQETTEKATTPTKNTATAANGEKTGGNGHHGGGHRRRSRHSRHRNTTHPYTEERRTTAQPAKAAGKTVTVASGGQGRRHFTIRKKKED
ncbi:YutD family protein [Levilactobacillus spicheri]